MNYYILYTSHGLRSVLGWFPAQGGAFRNNAGGAGLIPVALITLGRI